METLSSADSSANGYSHEIDVEDLRVVATLLQRHKFGKLPGPSLADELIHALMEENSRLRAETVSLKEKSVAPVEAPPKMGFAIQVMTSELERSGRRLEIAESAANDLEESSAGLQQEAEAMHAEFSALFEAEYSHEPDIAFKEDFTPPEKAVAVRPMPERMAEDPHETMTYKLWAMERKIERANERTNYYRELPEMVKELREALSLAKQGNWNEIFPEGTANESVSNEVAQGVVSDLVAENAQLKGKASRSAERAESLQSQLEASQDKVAEQKLTIREMQAKIDLLQRQLNGAERIIVDRAVSSWQ